MNAKPPVTFHRAELCCWSASAVRFGIPRVFDGHPPLRNRRGLRRRVRLDERAIEVSALFGCSSRRRHGAAVDHEFRASDGGRAPRSDERDQIRHLAWLRRAPERNPAERLVARVVHAQVPPKVEYHMTDWGQSLCPALDALLTWAEARPALSRGFAPHWPGRTRSSTPYCPRGVSRSRAPIGPMQRAIWPSRSGLTLGRARFTSG
jgi:hypothetical protein